MTSFPEKNIPVLSTREVVAFPGATLVFQVQQSANLESIREAEKSDGWILTLAQRDETSVGKGLEGLSRIGVLGRLKSARASKNGQLRVVFEGEERFQVVEVKEQNGYLTASGAALIDKYDTDEETLRSLRDSLRTIVLEIFELLPTDSSKIVEQINAIEDPCEFSYLVAQHAGLNREDAQKVLETTSVKNRLLRLLELLAARRESLKVQFKIQETLSENVGKRQREAILREQLKAIQEELGEKSDGPSADDYRKKVADAGMPEDAKRVALREVSRLERMGEQSAETHVIRNYLDLLCEMPWTKTSEGKIDLDHAERVLERDHYGLKKIKRRILEHLSIMKLRPEKRGSILLFVGPPGVGKTSLGKSVAEALGRQFVRASLGGVRDDADVRGHRRTYVGALPGRIIDGIRRAKTKDPIFVLDEIDKLARGWGGDPSSALLEVLDPEQNEAFHDHYLDVAFDLSQVLFICTANSKETIPAPLLDRMEIIDLSGYTTEEKFHIARKHLLSDALEAHGLRAEQVNVSDAALRRMIEGYTREAGVRSLKREIDKVCRAAAARIAKSPEKLVNVEPKDLTEILGQPIYEQEELNEARVTGVVTGMAWTPVGGDVLFVEAAAIPGEGKVVVTGQLGDVMKESSQIAVALARSRLEGIAKSVVFKDRDIHIHVPGGAIPKDGPSAGVTMFTAVASMMLGLTVNPKLAMTGEMTLRGKILPVGGIKEKVLAAARFGVTDIILPTRNAKDLEDIPEEVRKAVKFRFVSGVEDLLCEVFGLSGSGAGAHISPSATSTILVAPLQK